MKIPNSSSRTRAKVQAEVSENLQSNANKKRKKASITEEDQQGHIIQLLNAAESLNSNMKATTMGKPAARDEKQNQRHPSKPHTSGHHSFPSQSVVDRTTASGANSLRKRDGFFMFSLAMHEHIRRKMKGNVTHEM
jgi:hypothetical protein